MLTDKESLELEKVEIVDLLTSPIENRSSSWLGSIVLRWQRSRRWRYWKGVCSLIFVILLVLFCFLEKASFSLVFKKPVSFPKSVPASTVSGGQRSIACLVDAALSPDRHFIAVAGYFHGCGQIAGVPAKLLLYKLDSRRLVRQFSPDRAVQEALNGPVPSSQTGRLPGMPGTLPISITYTQLLWSVDSKRLAWTFSLPELDSPSDGAVLINGLQADLEVLFTQEGISTFTQGAHLAPEILLHFMSIPRPCTWSSLPVQEEPSFSC